MVAQLIEAEKATLGAALYDAEAAGLMLAMLRPADFTDRRHPVIAKAIGELSGEGIGIDMITVSSRLRERGALEKIGGTSYLAELVGFTPTAALTAAYCRQIRQASFRRHFEQVLADGAKALHEGADFAEVREKVDAALLRSAGHGVEAGPLPIADSIRSVINRFDAAQQQPGLIPGIETGFAQLDRLLGGLHRSDLLVLAARPAMGKTALALNIIRAAAGNGKKGLLFSLEMSRDQLVERLVASIARIDGAAARVGRLSQGGYARIADACAGLHGLPMMIDDTGALSLAELRARARRCQRKTGLDLIVIDYLQLLRGVGDNRTQEVGSLSRGLKALGKELNVPVLALAQLNRQVEQRTIKVPTLADLRDSGEIEQDADVIMFINRPHVYDQKADSAAAELIIAKNRKGPCCVLPLRWDAATTTFSDPS